MKVVILQPGYLPWLGYFDQMARCDRFVVYDDVQYDRHGWRNRNRIKTSQGVRWLTVPVLRAERPLIRDARVGPGSWARRHLMTLQQSHSRAPHAASVLHRLAPLYERPWTFLLDLDLAVCEVLRELLGLKTPLVLASDLKVEGGRCQRLVEMCRRLQADTYLTGRAARAYLDESLFAAQGIRVEYQDYQHPIYPQLHGDFVPYLSVVDLLVNCAPNALQILTGGLTPAS
ncbi:MAG: WbqC family protein [Candidatus Eremiobacterota bacterium]